MNRVGVTGGGQLAQMLLESFQQKMREEDAQGEFWVFANTKLEDSPSGRCWIDERHVTRKWVYLQDEKNNEGEIVKGSGYKQKNAEQSEQLVDICKQGITVCTEFENVPCELLAFMEVKGARLAVDLKVLVALQHRIKEKEFFAQAGIPTVKYNKIQSAEDILSFIGEFNLERIRLKSTELGYDGKSQLALTRSALETGGYKQQMSEAMVKFGACIAEEGLDSYSEASIMVAKDFYGNVVSGPVIDNSHESGILRTSVLPSELQQAEQEKMKEYAKMLSEYIGVGICWIEFFIRKDTGEVLANEAAPRPHNSGHVTIEGANYSQFDILNEIVLGKKKLPGNIVIKEGVKECVMYNAIGESSQELFCRLERLQQDARLYQHDYQKNDCKKGRKMGHVTILKIL